MRLLFLDDDPSRVPMLPRSVELFYVRTPAEFAAWLKEHGTPDAISFDHDLADTHYQIGYTESGTGTGADCAQWAIANGFIPSRIYVHSWNPDGAKKIANLFMDFLNAEPFPRPHPTIVVRPFKPHIPHLWTEE